MCSTMKREDECSLRCFSAHQASSSPHHPTSDQPNPTRSHPVQPRPRDSWANPKGALFHLLPVSFPSIRYTQGKQEGIRMGPDKHLVCWEISLGRSERLPSPLPASAHQMWGEGHITSPLCCRPRCSPSLSLSPFLLFLTLNGTHPHTCIFSHTTLSQEQVWRFRCRNSLRSYCTATQDKVTENVLSPLLIASISIIIENNPPQVGGHQLLLLVGETETGQLQLACSALWESELPVWNEGLLELVPVLQTAGDLKRQTQYPSFSLLSYAFKSTHINTGSCSKTAQRDVAPTFTAGNWPTLYRVSSGLSKSN